MNLKRTAPGRAFGCILLITAILLMPLQAAAAPWRDPSSVQTVRKVVSVNKLSIGSKQEKQADNNV